MEVPESFNIQRDSARRSSLKAKKTRMGLRVSDELINCLCPCNFQPRSLTGWGSQRVKIQLLTNLKGYQTKVKEASWLQKCRKCKKIFISVSFRLVVLSVFIILYKIRACLLQKSETRMIASIHKIQTHKSFKRMLFIWTFYVFGSCLLQSEFPSKQPHWLALDKWKTEKSWLVMYKNLLLLQHMPALFMTSLTQTAEHKMAALTVTFYSYC